MNNEKHGQWNQCTKMGADSLAENTENAQEFVCPTLQKALFCILFDTYIDPGSAFYIEVLIYYRIWKSGKNLSQISLCATVFSG